MPVATRILPSAYYDSVTLMQVAQALIALPGVRDAAVVMGTPANRDLLRDAGMATPEAAAASPNDLVVVVLAESADDAATAIDQVDSLLTARKTTKLTGAAGRRPRSLRAAIAQNPNANLAVISVAGRYAAREARMALDSGLNVMLYSDNVTVEDEIALKELASARGLLCMGPDAGTAIVNGIGLGFANAVPRGPIGIVSAAGTGLQSVSSDIARRGSGISQAIGTGGRDLSHSVGGRTMLAGLQALQADPQTEVIVLISKPPAEAIARKLLEQVRANKKPTVVCFLGADPGMIERAGAIPANTLEQAAAIAAAVTQKQDWQSAVVACEEAPFTYLPQAEAERARLQPSQRFIHGLYTGGTFGYEAQILAEGLTDDVRSNAPVGGRRTEASERKTAEASGRRSAVGGQGGHVILDLGADEYTVGRLHPMLDPALRNRMIVQAAEDTDVAVLLLDVVLGYGAHPDPAGEAARAIQAARARAETAGRYLPVVAFVCGTEDDPQRLSSQKAKLAAAGALVVDSNAQAVRVAALISQ